MSDPIRVFIVDDSAVVRETLTRILEMDGGFEIVGSAADPYIAAKKLASVVPDVITLDIEMPRMDGLSFLKRLMQQHPLPVVICSSVAESGSANALTALEYGAAEIIEKPRVGTKAYLEESRVRVAGAVRAAYASRHGVAKLNAKRPPSGDTVAASAPRRAASSGDDWEIEPKRTADVILERGAGHVPTTTEKIVCIGASTGGTEALREVLQALPINCPGVVIVQHMPERFTAAFAKRLDAICDITVKEAEDNDTVITGHALIAPGNRHTLLKRAGARYFVEVRDGPLVARHRPSVDVLFRSAARYAGPNAIGVIMTGMGDDGARGMREMHDAGAYTVAQDEASSVVFGMPNEAVRHGGVDTVVGLNAIAAHVMERVRRG